ncbi:hypothetical protein [Microbacterium sp. SD291]|uniref:hypothetical protein n=1 Tax=Microbacterium sp. SD291 TaxID=2782007 RepID=UPI001A96903E|nr:hypothetical protein [Microbacterium sp. SD291]MBO0981422.1 hypothetical protein [Microbacterium sp. SD291]
MNLDLDLSRDEASAFGPSSVSRGAILPYEGRAFLTRGDGLPATAVGAEHDGWLSPCNPVLVRGQAKILPLAWGGDGSGASTAEIAAFASKMQSAGMHWAGNWRVLDELKEFRGDSIRSYLTALTAAGATRVNSWTYTDAVGLALVWTGDAGAEDASLALHIVPSSWVSERHARKSMRGIDVRWSWSEVVELYASTTGADVGAAGSLAEADEQERDS